MARIFFMAFEASGQTPLVKKLRGAGHRIAQTEPRYPAFYDLLKQQIPAPEVFIVDCSRQSSHARESSNYAWSLKAHRATPFILYNVKKEDEARTREKVPTATILFDDKVEAALARLGLAAAPSTRQEKSV
jgi:hypothetical protein